MERIIKKKMEVALKRLIENWNKLKGAAMN